MKVTLLCQTRWCEANNVCQGIEVLPANPYEESQSNMHKVSAIRT